MKSWHRRHLVYFVVLLGPAIAYAAESLSGSTSTYALNWTLSIIGALLAFLASLGLIFLKDIKSSLKDLASAVGKLAENQSAITVRQGELEAKHDAEKELTDVKLANIRGELEQCRRICQPFPHAIERRAIHPDQVD